MPGRAAHRIPAILLLIWFTTAFVGATDRHRAYRVDDDLEREDVTFATFSPDGRALAFVRQRARKTAQGAADSVFVYKRNRDDIWVQDATGAPVRNLTNGLSDQSGAWQPLWSPDGRRLVFFSSRGGTVRLWAWDRETDRAEPLSNQSLEFDRPCQWLDHARLLCRGAAAGAVALPLSHMGAVASTVAEAWDRARHAALTASVLDSTEFGADLRHIYLIDTVNKTARPIAPTLDTDEGRFIDSWWVAPNGRTLAVATPVPSRYGMASLVRLGYPRQMAVYSIDGSELRFTPALPAQVLTSTIQWSPNGKELAFFAYDQRPVNPLVLYGAQAAEVMPEYLAAPALPLENPARLYRVNLETRTVEQVETADIDLGWLGAPTFQWTQDGELLFYASRRTSSTTTWNNAPRRGTNLPRPLGPPPAQRWWLLNRQGRLRPLIGASAELPAALQTLDGGETFLGLKDGDLFRISPRAGTVTNVTARFEPRVSGMKVEDADRQSQTHVLIQARSTNESADSTDSQGNPDDYVLDLASGAATHIARPGPGADLLAISLRTKEIVHVADNADGLVLYRAGSGSSARLLETNAYYRDIKLSTTRIIEFTNLNGDKLKALLVLPPDYVAGRRYPLVVNVYSGLNDGALRTYQSFITAGPTEFSTWGAAGYALLFPTIPKNVKGLDVMDEGESVLSMAGSAVPAAERVVTLGIADPERLFLFGFSFGGWTVSSVLAQTTRFKAAVGVSGVYYDEQLFGSIGSMRRGLVDRYGPVPHDWASPSAIVKRYWPSDTPWWRDLHRIQRNTPVYYADRIQTPLLLMHGDLDSVQIEQSEAMFNALTSMRKRAQFVRYWGEGHGFYSQANRRDYWQRMLAWYDEFGDILRDSQGNPIFEGDTIKTRGGAPALTPADFARFGPAAPAPTPPIQPTGAS